MSRGQAPAQALIDDFVGNAHGNIDRVRELLEKYPALTNAVASWKETAIQAAAQTGQVDIAEMLLAAGAPLDICTAAMLGRQDQVEAFLQADPGQVGTTGAHGIPLLYFPIIRGQISIAGLLLEHGADVNAGQGGNTPLHGAVLFGQAQMVRWLLDHGARVESLDYDGRTPLQLALENGQVEIANLLRVRG